uniref:Uncharacterized protein n=1 Tax=Anopheles darlingi TaxID=43151 RepID=A0A2M4D0K7_ANODA
MTKRRMKTSFSFSLFLCYWYLALDSWALPFVIRKATGRLEVAVRFLIISFSFSSWCTLCTCFWVLITV